MGRPVAKAKARRLERRTRIEEEETLAKAMTEHVRVVKKTDRSSNSDIAVTEIKNVIADSLERLWEELNATRDFESERAMRLSAEEGALIITRSLVYGAPVKIREEEVPARYCKEHR
jgi:hypothetical protein